MQQQLLAKENSKPPNVVPQQAPREEVQSVPANNVPTPVNNSNVSQAPQPVQPQVPQQQVPQQHQVAQSHPPPQKNVEPEPIPEQRNVVQQNNAVQLPKTQPKQEVTTVNVGISTKNVILPGGLFEDEQVEIQFGKVNTISDKNVDTIKEQSNQEDNSQDNSQKQVNPIFPEVNNPGNLEGSHYEQDLVPPMIPYPYGLPQNQPYPPYVMDQERGHMVLPFLAFILFLFILTIFFRHMLILHTLILEMVNITKEMHNIEIINSKTLLPLMYHNKEVTLNNQPVTPANIMYTNPSQFSPLICMDFLIIHQLLDILILDLCITLVTLAPM